jgi:hypothetical protein
LCGSSFITVNISTRALLVTLYTREGDSQILQKVKKPDHHNTVSSPENGNKMTFESNSEEESIFILICDTLLYVVYTVSFSEFLHSVGPEFKRRFFLRSFF